LILVKAAPHVAGKEISTQEKEIAFWCSLMVLEFFPYEPKYAGPFVPKP